MFFIRRLTLTNANTNYQLYSLFTALDGRVPARCAELQVQAGSGNTAVVLVGDGSLSGSVYGKELDTLDSMTIGAGSHANTVALKNVWLRSASAGQTVNVILRVA